MKTVLIILGCLMALALLGLVWPLLIAGGIAWFFFSSGSIGWGIAFSIFGILAEFGYIMGIITESGSGSYDNAPGRSGISWPQAFTAFYIIDHIREKNRDE